jgi:hypothetical protein
MTCQVCCEKTRYNVRCDKCKYDCCRVCVRTYLCGQLTEPHCMNCKTKWSLNFVEDAVGLTFFKSDYKKAQSNTYYEFEKSQLPLVQDNIKEFLFNERKQNTIDKITRENKEKAVGRYGCIRCVGSIYCDDECKKCNVVLSDKQLLHHSNIRSYLYYTNIPSHYKKIVKELKLNNFWKRDIRTITRCLCKYTINISKTNDSYYKCSSTICSRIYCKVCLHLLKPDGTHNEGDDCIPIRDNQCPCIDYLCDKCIIDTNKKLCNSIRVLRLDGVSVEEENERKRFIMKCQVANCPGFLSTQYKCGVCDVYTCADCLDVIEDDDHKCKPENIESAKLIKKETKPCPTCATRIYKIDGCDQMWCVDCKTAFSWITGQVTNSKIHNPHYYEYLRQTQGSVPRDPDDIPNGCRQFPTSVDIRRYLNRFGASPTYDVAHTNEFRTITHKIGNLITLFSLNVTEFHKFIVEMDALIIDTNVNIYNNELIRCRVLYSLERMDVEIFKRNTYMYHQKSQHHNNYMETMYMFKQICKDMFGFIMDILRNLKNINHITMPTTSLGSMSVVNSISLMDFRLIQYGYMLELNDKLNDILKQLMNSIIYVKSNLTVNKYYTNDCDKHHFKIKMKTFNETDFENNDLFVPVSKQIREPVLIMPSTFKWTHYAYYFELKYITY